MPAFIDAADSSCRPLWLVRESEADRWYASLPAADRAGVAAWVRANGFRGERGRVLLVPGAAGELAGVAVGVGRLSALTEISPPQLWGVASQVPSGRYQLAATLTPAAATQAALGWALGRYRFERYKRTPGTPPAPVLVAPPGADLALVRRLVEADTLARDLINTPACDLGPAELGAAVAAVASRYGAQFRQVIGDALIAEGLPTIHAVGRAAQAVPRLLDLRFGHSGPRITLVGKGVCFDTGGLDLKPSSAMALMKKDMGGAACALAVAQLVMDAALPVRLRLLIPAVENSVAGNAFRPGDVLRTRSGVTVEVTNTDAEGRLVLADALALADEERPDLIIDLATLTGAARVALGPELPALYASDDRLAADLATAGRQTADPVWPMPLHVGYEDELSSRVADVVNAPSSPFAGSIVAALFLRRFVAETTPWIHLDLYAWNGKDRPGRPVGGEAQTVRALYAFLRQRYGASG